MIFIPVRDAVANNSDVSNVCIFKTVCIFKRQEAVIFYSIY